MDTALATSLGWTLIAVTRMHVLGELTILVAQGCAPV
jgi:hypothetical protein